MAKQLAKIVTVVRVRDYKDLPFVERDLALIKVLGVDHVPYQVCRMTAYEETVTTPR